MSERRISDFAADVVEGVLANYEDGFQWELIAAPMPNEQGAFSMGACFVMTMPSPSLSKEKFVIGSMFPDFMIFHDVESVRKIVFDYTQALMGAKSEWLKGRN